MTDVLFEKLWKDALDQPDQELYISEYGYPDWFDEISEDSGEVIAALTKIHTAAHMTVKDILSAAGLTQAAFSVKFCIPKRTIENWSAGSRQCPDYVRLMLIRLLGLIDL